MGHLIDIAALRKNRLPGSAQDVWTWPEVAD
jgi:hypothetical protein